MAFGYHDNIRVCMCATFVGFLGLCRLGCLFVYTNRAWKALCSFKVLILLPACLTLGVIPSPTFIVDMLLVHASLVGPATSGSKRQPGSPFVKGTRVPGTFQGSAKPFEVCIAAPFQSPFIGPWRRGSSIAFRPSRPFPL